MKVQINAVTAAAWEMRRDAYLERFNAAGTQVAIEGTLVFEGEVRPSGEPFKVTFGSDSTVFFFPRARSIASEYNSGKKKRERNPDLIFISSPKGAKQLTLEMKDGKIITARYVVQPTSVAAA